MTHYWKVRLINEDGTFWLQDKRQWSDDCNDGQKFADEAEADRVVEDVKRRNRGLIFKVKAIKFKGELSIKEAVVADALAALKL